MFNRGPDALIFLRVFYKSVLWRGLFSFRNRGSSSVMRAASCIFHVGNVMENLLSLLTDFAEVIHGPPLSLSFWVFVMLRYNFCSLIALLRCTSSLNTKILQFRSFFSTDLDYYSDILWLNLRTSIFCCGMMHSKKARHLLKKSVCCLPFLKIRNLVWNLLRSNTTNSCQREPLWNKKRTTAVVNEAREVGWSQKWSV